MYIAVCDDRVEELKKISKLFDLWESNHKGSLKYKVFTGAFAVLDAAQKEHFTHYVLDVMMPGMDGIAVARELRTFDQAAEIVFLTSSSEFAYESYSVRALDYLLKPVQPEKLFSILDRIYWAEKKPQEGLTVKSEQRLVRIPFSELAYIEVYGKHLYFNLSDGTVHKVVGTMKQYQDILLSRPEFMRSHRSYIVNMFQVSEMSVAGLQMFSGKRVPVSRLLYPQLQKEYLELVFTIGKEGAI